MTRYTILLGSARTGRQGKRVADFVIRRLEQRLGVNATTKAEAGAAPSSSHSITLLDPLDYPNTLLRFEERYNLTKNPTNEFTQIHNLLTETDGFIAITPEYNHSYSGTFKVMFDNFNVEFKHKPFGIISYSMGNFGGVRAAEALRVVPGALGIVIPTSMPIPAVHEALDADGNPAKPEFLNPLLDAFLNELEWYTEALKAQRERVGLPNQPQK
eukprot:GEZU01020518.1.p1 GENE.GEZU01020518.1~~GEZU01020518.1.p1  ORF type:complete len:214 (+),score=28.28 GEZU01020518.1:158-799(+)